MPKLQSETYVFDPRPEFPLLVSAKRYWIPSSSRQIRDAITLVLAHGTGFLNEHWDPVIEDLYELVANASTFTRSPKVRDVWAIEAPNHGVGAQLNEEVLKSDTTRSVSVSPLRTLRKKLSLAVPGMTTQEPCIYSFQVWERASTLTLQRGILSGWDTRWVLLPCKHIHSSVYLALISCFQGTDENVSAPDTVELRHPCRTMIVSPEIELKVHKILVGVQRDGEIYGLAVR